MTRLLNALRRWRYTRRRKAWARRWDKARGYADEGKPGRARRFG